MKDKHRMISPICGMWNIEQWIKKCIVVNRGMLTSYMTPVFREERDREKERNQGEEKKCNYWVNRYHGLSYR